MAFDPFILAGLSLVEMGTFATPAPAESGPWPMEPGTVEVSPVWDIHWAIVLPEVVCCFIIGTRLSATSWS